MLDSSIEALLRHDRRVAIGSIAAVVALAWLYLWHLAAGMDPAMDHASMGMAGMAHGVDATTLALSFVMWTVMMAGMMLPSATPAILLFAAMVRKNAEHGKVLPGVWTFAAGYLAVWTGFSLAAALLQATLEHYALMTPHMTLANTGVSGAALIAAGIYQLTPLKHACLAKCRNPLEFFLTRWQMGAVGAFRMGVEHGVFCVGCCWALMVLLFVAGVMNLLAVALIAAFVLAEKLFPASRRIASWSGAALILTGVVLVTVAFRT